MRKNLVVLIFIFLALLLSRAPARKFGQTGNEFAPDLVLRKSGSEISSTPFGVTVKFEAIVLNDPGRNCIRLSTPDEFEKYGDDPKWLIPSVLGFELGFLDRLPERSKGTVTGRYVRATDTPNEPCDITTGGQVFEITSIEYF